MVGTCPDGDIHRRWAHVALVLLGLFLWTVIGCSVAAAWHVSRSTAEKVAEKQAEKALLPFHEWQEVFAQYLEERSNKKTGE